MALKRRDRKEKPGWSVELGGKRREEVMCEQLDLVTAAFESEK